MRVWRHRQPGGASYGYDKKIQIYILGDVTAYGRGVDTETLVVVPFFRSRFLRRKVREIRHVFGVFDSFSFGLRPCFPLSRLYLESVCLWHVSVDSNLDVARQVGPS